jgi:hypothetical protein
VKGTSRNNAKRLQREVEVIIQQPDRWVIETCGGRKLERPVLRRELQIADDVA